jgi:acetyltransferase-like isoleucine patch superfamily enzyme
MRFARWWRRLRGRPTTYGDELAASERRIAKLRASGAHIGAGCVMFSADCSREPWLVELGAGVVVGGGVTFVPHDGAAVLLRDREPDAQIFGRIVVGDRTLIGHGCLVLAGTTIGPESVVAAGSVLRGSYPANSVVAGNPARVVGRASLLRRLLAGHPHKLATLGLPDDERRRVVERHFGIGA